MNSVSHVLPQRRGSQLFNIKAMCEDKFEKMIRNPTKHQLRAFYDAREKACKDAMKSSKSKNPHNSGSELAGFWDYIYEQYYEIQ